MTDTKLEQIKQRIERIGDLPTLPAVVSKVLELAHDLASSMGDIGSVIQNDVSLSMKVLKIANSPFYALRHRVGTVERALIVLGMEEVVHLVMAVSVFQAFPDLPGQATLDREQFWDHSAGCGYIARLLARRLGLQFEGEEFVAGLVHDVGKIVLDQYFHDGSVTVLELVQNRHTPMLKAERLVLGATHPEIGEWLLRRWRLPEALIDSVRYHHEPEEEEQRRSLVALVHMADLLCSVSGIGFGEDRGGFCLADSPAWGILAAEKPELEKLDIERLTFGLEDEIEHIREFVRLARR